MPNLFMSMRCISHESGPDATSRHDRRPRAWPDADVGWVLGLDMVCAVGRGAPYQSTGRAGSWLNLILFLSCLVFVRRGEERRGEGKGLRDKELFVV